MQQRALSGFTQLQALSLQRVSLRCSATQATALNTAPSEELLSAVSQLTLLTELFWTTHHYPGVEPPAAASFSAVTASTKLRSLTLGWHREMAYMRVGWLVPYH
jgi:hypothetical protein